MCVHLCKRVHPRVYMVQGWGAGQKHLLFSAKWCYLDQPITEDYWPSQTCVAYLVWVTLWCLCKCPLVSTSPVVPSWRFAFLWRNSDSHPCSCLSAKSATSELEWVVCLWPAWLAVSFEALVQSWPHQGQWEPWSPWGMTLVQGRVRMENDCDTKSFSWKSWGC